MSCIRLNIIDQSQTISGEVHASVGDAIVAALAAEPETIEELALALARFIKPDGNQSPLQPFHKEVTPNCHISRSLDGNQSPLQPFHKGENLEPYDAYEQPAEYKKALAFHKGENLEPCDAGILIVDLAARVVAVDSTYSLPTAEGHICIQTQFSEELVPIPYRLSDDWLFVHSIPEYQGVCKERRDRRQATRLLDAREVLYGRALSEFIAFECFAARNSTDEDLSAQIHIKWLMSARADLQDRSPREVLLDKYKFIDSDLHSRELQWTFTGECPPPLPLQSNAYARAPFGTHEIVVYYYLVRYLIGECLDSLQAQKELSPDGEIARLEQLKSVWLDRPNRDFPSKTPSHIIEWERRRIPMTVTASEAIIDENCPLCQMMAEELETPMFWHLDGSSMDDCFEFSFYKTREEWEAEQQRWEEFNQEFEREWKNRKYDSSTDEPLMWIDDGDDESLIQ